PGRTRWSAWLPGERNLGGESATVPRGSEGCLNTQPPAAALVVSRRAGESATVPPGLGGGAAGGRLPAQLARMTPLSRGQLLTSHFKEPAMPIEHLPESGLTYYLVAFDKNGRERADDPDGLMGQRVTGVLAREP